MPQPPSKWFIQLFLEALSDTMLIILIALAIISIVLGLVFPEKPEDRKWGYK